MDHKSGSEFSKGQSKKRNTITLFKLSTKKKKSISSLGKTNSLLALCSNFSFRVICRGIRVSKGKIINVIKANFFLEIEIEGIIPIYNSLRNIFQKIKNT